MAKLERINFNSLVIILAIFSVIFLYFNYQNKKEGFANMSNDIEKEILNQYMSDDLNNLSNEQLKERIAASRARLAKFGLYPSATSPDMSKYVLKTEMRGDEGKCTVSSAEDRDKYILKSAVPEPKCPGIDMSKYVLKSSIQPEKICPPPKDIDYSRYVLKSSLPPTQKCPPCICPKVKVSAGLCKACPPPPKPTCPEVKPCPNVKCPEPKPCPPQQDCPQCHGIKYVKVPVVLKQTVKVNENGEIVSQTEEEQNSTNGTANTANTINGTTNNTVNNSISVPAASNSTETELNAQNNQAHLQNHTGVNSSGRQDALNKRFNELSGRHNNSSELLNNSRKAYSNNSRLDAYNPANQPLSDLVSSNLSDQNNASKDDEMKGTSNLSELVGNESVNGTEPSFNVNTRKINTVQNANFTGPGNQRLQQTVPGSRMLTNQPQGQSEKCGPVKFNDVFKRYGVYGLNNY